MNRERSSFGLWLVSTAEKVRMPRGPQRTNVETSIVKSLEGLDVVGLGTDCSNDGSLELSVFDDSRAKPGRLTLRMYFCSSVKSVNLVVRLESQASWEEGALDIVG